MGCFYGLHLNLLIREGNHFTRAGSRPAKASTFGASKFKSDIFRPTVRVTKDTPTTFAELTTEEIAKARREKTRTGRAKRRVPIKNCIHTNPDNQDYRQSTSNTITIYQGTITGKN